MLIPELVPFSKVICMDVDIIVDCDMKELWNIDLEEYALAASVDPLTGLPEHAQNWLKLQADHVYFNAGLMIINCDKWRTEKTVQSLIKITKELGQKIRYVDQDVLNTYFDGNNYLPFDECYNSMPYFVKNKEGYNPKCYHFAWKVKPWLCNCFKSEVFWKYAQKTPYYEWLLQGLNKSQKGLNDNLTHFLSKKNNKNKEQFQKFAVNARKRLQV
jgi:lipopolysaccharide biosynthesis glycosyltransferase